MDNDNIEHQASKPTTTARILSNTASPTKNNTAAASFAAMWEKAEAIWQSGLADWLTFATQMETRDGSSMIARRLEFHITNELNSVHRTLFGNNTDTTFIPADDARIPRGTRFCARLNLNYQENAKAKYLADHPECDKASLDYDPITAGNDLNWVQRLIDHKEALLNYNMWLAAYQAWKMRYEAVTGKEFVYVPVAEQGTLAPKDSNSNRALAAALLAKAS